MTLLKRAFKAIPALLVLVVAGLVLHHSLADLRWGDLALAFASLSGWKLAGCLGAGFASLLVLGSFDVFAAGIAVPGRLSAGKALFTGVVSHAISNTLGFHALTGGAVRYRLYRASGLGPGDIARLVSLVGLGVGLGFSTTLALVLWFDPTIALGFGRAFGLVLTLLLLAFLGWLARRPRQVALHSWRLPLPSAPTALRQMAVGVVEMVTAILAFYVLLPDSSFRGFVDFVPLYIGAVLLGVVSQAPGGVGVFEATMLAALPAVERPVLVAALLTYRAFYGLLPFVLAIATLAVTELPTGTGSTNTIEAPPPSSKADTTA
ncbi:MAG: UPF0104 family protein [Thermoanaerobaculia bacterium]